MPEDRKVHPAVRILICTIATVWLPYFVFHEPLVNSILQALVCSFLSIAWHDWRLSLTHGWKSDEAS